MCISNGEYVDNRDEKTDLLEITHFASQDEMIKIFEDLPEAIENTVEIAVRCALKLKEETPSFQSSPKMK